MKKPHYLVLALTALFTAPHIRGAETTDTPKNHRIILLRHGESIMNTQKRTSGWGDTHLSEKGVAAGLKVGELLKQEGIFFDVVYSSTLSRAIKTAWLTLEGMDKMWIPVLPKWQLNETNQGAFEGKTREEIVAMLGLEQVEKWEAGFEARPPKMAENDPAAPENDIRYAAVPRDVLPRAESMEDTLNRIRAYWLEELVPVLRSGKTILVVGHSNALRALSKSIDDSLDVKTLKQMAIPNTIPIIYTLDADMKPVSRRVLEPAGN